MYCVEGKAYGTHLGITQKDPQVEMFEHMGFIGSCVTYLSKISVQPHGHGTSFKPLSITCETKMRWEVDKRFSVLQIRFRDVCEYMNLHVSVYVSVHANVNVSVYASVHLNVNVGVYASVHAVAYKRRSILTACM